jgi:hypothetical protein
MRDQTPRGASLGDFLFGVARDAIADMRGKLIDEGWFGRRSHDVGGMDLGWDKPNIHDQPGPIGMGQSSFEEQWAVRAPSERGHEPQGLDLDR